jgi:hypothetical protein
MMKKIIAICAVLVSWSAMGDTVSNKTIKLVHVHAESGVFFETNEAFINPFSCTQVGRYRIAPGATYEKEILSILLSAKMADKKITFHIPTGCPGGYVQVDWVSTHD